MLAANRGQLEEVRLLFYARAALMDRHHLGWMALMPAALEEELEAVWLLCGPGMKLSDCYQ